MTLQLTWIPSKPPSRRDTRAVGARAGSRTERPTWRSHTFADGVRSLTLVGPLDVGLAGRLWTRISELIERGCRRLIVDASAIEPAGDQPALLAAVFAGRTASYQAVVVAPPGSALVDLLPSSIGVTLSLTEARRQLTTGIVRHEARKRSAPAARIPPADRHALAVRQSLRWAERAAREGDYEHALSWLDVIERVDGPLAEEWRCRREVWVAAWKAQIARGPCEHHPGRRR
jgi:hypothetical protein